MAGKYLLAALLAASLQAGAAAPVTHWSYEGGEGPANWGRLSPDFSLCEKGKNQSPVNINGVYKAAPGKLNLAFSPSGQQIVNNGHAIQVNVSGKNTLTLDGKVYTLQQFHFHAPAENLISGKQYPLEAHFVYKSEGGDISVLALMFEQGKADGQLENALQQLPPKPGDTVSPAHPLDIKALLSGREHYYRFSGSLTTPPCSEGVTWLVLAQPAQASEAQITRLHGVLHHDNNRPVQPLNGRVIIE